MNIVHVGDNLVPKIGGVYTTVSLFLTAVRELGWQPNCISLDPTHRPARGFEAISVPKSTSWIGRKWGTANRQRLTEAEAWIANSDIIVCHSLYLFHATWAARMAKKHRKPLVVIPHGGLDPYCFTYRRLRKALWLQTQGRILFNRAHILYSSLGELNKSLPQVRSPRTHIVSWPVGNALSALAESCVPRAAPRRLLLAGRLHPMKRPLETIRAFRNAGLPAELVIAGPPSLDIQERDLAAAAGYLWGRTITYLGEIPQSELLQQMQRSDGLILLSYRENFGHVVAEGLTLGLPVIISDGVDIHGLVTRYQAGFVFPINSQPDVENALQKALASSPTQWCTMSQNAFRLGATEFSFQVFKTKIKALFSSLALLNL